ncbi:MAG: DNA polymerase III subunit beta [Pseudomonadota bacterium]
MKIEFDRNQLLTGLQKIGAVAEKKSTMPILGNLHLEAKGESLTISATDLEIGIQTTCPVKVVAEGKVCTPAHQLIEIVKQLPEKNGRLQKTENDWITLSCGKAQFRLAGVAADEFPQVVNAGEFKFSNLKTNTIQTAIEKTGFAISTDEMRYNLNGVYLEVKKEKGGIAFRMVATDGHRLAMFTRDLADDETLTLAKGVILPRKGINELRRLLEGVEEKQVEVSVTGTNACFRLNRTILSMRLVVGEFPDYTAVIPKGNKKKLVVNRNALNDSLRRVSLLSEGKSKCVKFGIRGAGIHLAATTPELGEAEEDIAGEFDGGELEIGFNARYVLDALAAVDGDKVLFELDHEQSPGIIRAPNDPSYFGVIMPMRI